MKETGYTFNFMTDTLHRILIELACMLKSDCDKTSTPFFYHWRKEVTEYYTLTEVRRLEYVVCSKNHSSKLPSITVSEDGVSVRESYCLNSLIRDLRSVVNKSTGYPEGTNMTLEIDYRLTKPSNNDKLDMLVKKEQPQRKSLLVPVVSGYVGSEKDVRIDCVWSKNVVQTTYIGEYVNGKFDGNGLLVTRSFVHVGNFSDGNVHGPGLRVNVVDGQTSIGLWSEGRFDTSLLSNIWESCMIL